MKRVGRALLFGLLLVGAGVFVWRETVPPPADPGARSTEAGRPGRRGGGGRRGFDGPVTVLTAPAKVEDVPVTLEAVGTAQALNAVVVRSQVEGRLLELAFREGQDVQKGDLLARIDPTIYQAQYDQALARKAQNEANLANARLDLQRYDVLAAKDIGSRKQADTQKAAVLALEAQLKADQGAIDNARAYLDYTTIRAPIDGRLGIRFVDPGNLVRSGDGTGIVQITQLRPIAVVFNLPQQNLRAVNEAMGRGGVPIDALDADNRTSLDRGRLEVVDNQVDGTTGTVKLKAVFPNASLQLWPGAFVNVRLTVDTLRNVVTVPSAAVQRGPTGSFVYVVADDKVNLRPVTVGRQAEATSVITAGLSAPDRVVTTGFFRLNDGDRVIVSDPPPGQPSPGPEAAPGVASAAPPPRGRREREADAGSDRPTGSAGELRPDRDRSRREGRPRGEGVAGSAPPGERRGPETTGSGPPRP